LRRLAYAKAERPSADADGGWLELRHAGH
jgi:hypothetical protein